MSTPDATGEAVYSQGVPSSFAPRWIGATLIWLIATTGPVIWLRRRWTLTGDLTHDAWYVTFFIVVGVICALFVDWRAVARRVERPVIVAAVLLVACLTLSAAWSLDGAYTFTHGIRLAGTLAAALLLVTRYTSGEQMATLWVAVQIGCVWSVVDIRRLVPGSQDARENWVGIFVNRNLLGLVSAVGLALGVLLAVQVVRTWCGRSRSVAVGVLTVCVLLDVYLLRGSGSATPIGVLVLLALLIAAVVLVRRFVATSVVLARGVLAGASVLLVALVAGSALLLPHVAGLAGRNSELSRRRPLWDFVVDRIAERPFWGWGYLGPWDDRGFRRELRTYVDKAWDLHSAHNSTLEVALGAGVLVLAVFLTFLVLGMRRALVDAVRPADRWDVLSLWPLVAISWFLLESLTETFLVADTLPTLLVFVGALVLAPGDHSIDVDGRSSGESSSIDRESRSVQHE